MGLLSRVSRSATPAAKPDDVLVLSKPIGTGIITTAGKQGVADPDVLAGAVETMAALNRPAAQAMMKVGVNAATDITGFGLFGHLKSMVKGSGVAAEVNLSAVPVLSGVRELLEQGVAPGGTHRNVGSVNDVVSWDASLTDEDRMLLCDAQTSGGLLMSVPAERVDALVAALQEEGAQCAAVVGRITEGPTGTIVATP